MSKPRDERQKDLFRPDLEQIIDMGHPLVRLAGEMDWGFLERRFASVCATGPGQPPLPARLIAGLFILKHMHSLSDEVLCARWVENPYIRCLQASVFYIRRLSAEHDRGRNSDDREEIAEPYIRSELIARTKIPHSRRRSSKRTEPIYYGGRRKPSHGFSRSPSVLVMAKLTFALSGYALSTAPSGTSPASR